VEVHYLGWCMLARIEVGTCIVVSVGEACESLSADYFGKPSNTLEPSLWIHSPGSGVTLLLRLGTPMFTVGWNVLSLNLVGVFFYKRQVLSIMVSFACVFIFVAYQIIIPQICTYNIHAC
jgi:hypothetical protein